MFYIYRIINKINNKVYIGKTGDLYQRMHAHLHMAKHGKNNNFYKNNGKYNYIHKSIAKYGKENFIFEKIDEDENEEIIFKLEKFYIFHMMTRNPLYGYNLTDGGEGTSGKKHSEKAIQKMKNKAIGRLHTEKTKIFIKNILCGDGCKHNKLTSTEIPEIFRLRFDEKLSYVKIGKMFNVTKTCIRDVCLGHSWKNISSYILE